MKSIFVMLMLAAAALAAGPKESVVYGFQGGTDGAYPLSGLVADQAGNLYGTTQEGGGGTCASGCGAVFELSPPATAGGPWTETILYRFEAAVGTKPWGGVIFDQAGNLYGAAEFGGANRRGTVFELSPPSTPGGAWTPAVLYAFQGHRDGENPEGSLTFDAHGNLFGTTYAGGIPCSDSAPDGCGTIFELSPPTALGGTWNEKVVYRFDPSFAGGPAGTLIFDSEGNLYGTAVNDGRGVGTAYELSPSATTGAWHRTVLHAFGGNRDGAYVWAGLTWGRGGALFGATTGFGGEVGDGGAVFELRPLAANGNTWRESILTAFDGQSDANADEGPYGSLVADKAGALYGVTSSGGTGSCTNNGWMGCGFAFKVAPPSAPGSKWTTTVLHDFAGGSDGADAMGGLIFGLGHKLYGTTFAGGGGSCAQGGLSGCGTVFELEP